MIVGIGIDSVEIKRFAHWHTFNQKQLNRIFSPDEIVYCLQNNKKKAERFAVRFAAREAFYKALCSFYPDHIMPFLTLCKLVQVKRSPIPQLIIDSVSIAQLSHITAFLSLTHTSTIATAQVILQQDPR